MRQLALAMLLLGIVVIGSPSASATPIIELVLDNTNGYSVELEPGAIIEQPERDIGNYYIQGTNVLFAMGTSDVADFSGEFYAIGGGDGYSPSLPFRPRDMVLNSRAFTILVTTSGHKYDAFLTYFYSRDNGDTGTPPVPYNDPGAVFALTPAFETEGVPEPSTIVLLLTGAVGLVGYGWRRKKQLAA